MSTDTEAASDARAAGLRGGMVLNWHSIRNSLLGSARFRRWAARFPLTRRVARRHAGALFDLCAGFVYSQALFACVRLRLLEAVGRRPQTTAELAHLTGIPSERLQRLLDAAVSLELLETGGRDCYRLGPKGALIASQPALADMIDHHWMLYEDLRDPIALLRTSTMGTHLEQFWSYARSCASDPAPGRNGERYSALMTATRSLFADEVLHAYDFRRHHCVLDVGGGEAMWAIELARRYPTLNVIVFDLPEVAKLASARIHAHDMRERVRVVGGDFRCDALPSGADLVMLNRVLHDHDDDAAACILTAARKVVAPDATLMIAEPMLEAGEAARVGAAYFNFYFLAMGSGRPRSAAEIRRLLEQTGFAHIRRHATDQPMCASIITARGKM